MMKKVCHLTSVHPPFDIRIFHKECKTLHQGGHRVVLIAPHDKEEDVEGILIRALPKAKNRLDRLTRVLWKTYRSAAKENAHVYHFHDLELIPVGILLRLQGKKVIYDVHEDYPRALLSREWISFPLRRGVISLVVLAEWLGTKLFHGIIAATPHIAKRFPTGKTATIQNFPFLNTSGGASALPHRQRGKIVAYVGIVSMLRGAKQLVEAMGLLPLHLNARLRIAGMFDPMGLEEELKRLPGWDRVDFLGWQRHEKAMAMLKEARIGLLVFHPDPNHKEAQPNKLFEYMSAGIPVIASDFPLWRRVVEEAQCGLVVDPLNPKAIAEEIQWLLEHPAEAEEMGKMGQTRVREYFNWDVEARKLLILYERILGQR